MGTLFSKKQKNLRDVLFSLEEKISKTEHDIDTTKKKFARFKNKLYILNVLIIFIGILYTYILAEDSDFLTMIGSLILLGLIMYTVSFLFNIYIGRKMKRLKNLQELQKKNIEELKNDKSFLETKEIYDKYECNRSLSSRSNCENVGNLMLNNHEDLNVGDRGLIDKVADVVLGKDPENMYALICNYCYTHNGLKYPNDAKDLKFYCCNCKALNSKSDRILPNSR